MEIDLPKLKDKLEKLLKEVGIIIKEGFRNKNKKIMTKSSPEDFVTEYDIKVNRMIVEFLEKNYPEVNIISEEEKPIYNDSDYSFHIDPIDGTKNFIRGIEMFLCGISLAKNNEVILSMTYNPLSEELFHAIKGKGAYLNENKIFVGNRDFKHSDIVIRARPSQKEQELVYKIITNVDQVKNYHCCHFEISGIASNKLDAVITSIDNNTWDVAPYLIIKEAGGKVTDWKGDDFDLSKKGFVASNGVIHEELLKITKNLV